MINNNPDELKQAILVTAYKNFLQLNEMISLFDENFYIFIHVDKKSKLSPDERSKLLSNENVKVLSQQYKVNWGSINHLNSILFLADEALKYSEVQFVHLISGQDFPIKSNSYFDSFVNGSESKDYIEVFSLPTIWLDRIIYYHLYDAVDVKKHGWIIMKFITLQRRLGFKRSITRLPDLYGGSTWWSLTRQTVFYVLQFAEKDRSLLKRLRYTFCSEEIYFQTVIMNSPLSAKVVNNNLRYIEWKSNRGGFPSILDESDYASIQSSNSLFARKIDSPFSDKLVAKLIGYLKNK